MNPGWIADVADRFWELAGEPPPFPRDFAHILPMALPVAVVLLPALTLDRIEGWFARRGHASRFAYSDRRLRGCLVAYGGDGIVFVDGRDPLDERRFTLAHEGAHFLLDYQQPRQAAIATIGARITDVLDGHRPATSDERIDAVLANCSIGVHLHLLSRERAVSFAETRADRLAFQLLAPEDEVRRRVGTDAPAPVITRVLRETFGLPAGTSETYARELRRMWRPPSFVEWLRP